MCTGINNVGFWSGLWDGAIAVFTVLANIFWSTTVFQSCTGLGYVVGFGIGLLIFAGLCLRFSVWAVLIMAVVWAISTLIANPLVLVLLIAVIVLAFEYFKRNGMTRYSYSWTSYSSVRRRWDD